MAKEKEKKNAKPRMTKAKVMAELSEKSGLSRKQVTDVFDALKEIMKRELSKRGPEQFEIPGIVRLKVRNVEAQVRTVRNPQTQEAYQKQFPASRKVRATVVKSLKDLVL